MVNKILLIDIENLDRENTNPLINNWSHHPIGLMYLAASITDKYPQIDIKIFHTVTSESPIEDLIDIIDIYDPDLIGLRALSIFRKQFEQVSELIRREIPHACLVAGGPYPSSCFEEILQKHIVDIVIVGEGEQTFLELVERLNPGSELPLDVNGTVVNHNGNIIKNPKRELIKDINRIPFPRYDLINTNDYSDVVNQSFKKGNYAYIFSSRGCPYKCFYCHQLFGKKNRRRSAENIVSEMREHYKHRNIKEFVFIDDIFNVPLDKAKVVLKLISKEFSDIRINFPNGLRADSIDDEFIELLEACGTVQVSLAVESANQRLQKLMGKNLNISKAAETIYKMSKKFITSTLYIIGFPTESYEEAIETINFAKQFKFVAQPVMNILHVYEDNKILKKLNPSDKQKKQLCAQSTQNHSNRVFENGCFTSSKFYGDYFPDDVVPLNSKDITKLQVRWIHDVINDKERIKNSYNLMKKFLDEDEIIIFYKHFFNNEHFNLNNLKSIL